MQTTKGGLFRIISISLVVLMGWFGLLNSTGVRVEAGIATTKARTANFGPGTDLFEKWVITPTTAIIRPSAIPTPTIVADPITRAILPATPWDTAYLKVGTVLRDEASATYRMWYESARVITTTATGLLITSSAIGFAISKDGISWDKPVLNAPVFGPNPGSWDSNYVGTPRVIFDGDRYRMFYVGSNVGGRFDGTLPASIGIAESGDGINWTRGGRTTPLIAPTPGAWDSLYVEPAGARIVGGAVKLYYTGSDSPIGYRTGLASSPGGVIGAGLTSFSLIKNPGNPVKINGVSDRAKGSYALNFNDVILFWYVSNVSGSDLIYQAYSNGNEVNFFRDPDTQIVRPLAGAPNDLVGQLNVAGVSITGSTPKAQMWFTGVSSNGLQLNGFRAVSPPPPLTSTVTTTVTPTVPGVLPITPVNLPTRSGSQPTPTGGVPVLPPGIPVAGPGSFFTPTPGDGNYPAFYATWRRVDEPVRAGFANRSWIYGGLPYGFRFLRERYEEGNRLVLYHDKARMEAFGSGGVSNGLLVKELISGLLQVGDNKFEPRTPANEAIAGDAIEVNINNPAYYSLGNVASLNNDRRAPDRTGQQVIETINRSGQVGADGSKGGFNISYGYYEPVLGHNVANVFWDFMRQSGIVLNSNGYATEQVTDWLTVYGLPLTEPFWTRATVGGASRDVLVQAFERRVLTFTPANADPFKVEVGNVGRHYFRWRYNQSQ